MIYRCDEFLLTEDGFRHCDAPATHFMPRDDLRARMFCDRHRPDAKELPIQFIDRFTKNKSEGKK